MEKIKNVEEFLKNDNIFNLYYISHENCNVCKMLLPKIEDVLKKYDKISSKYIDILEFPELKGRLSVFTVPTIIVNIEGKETIRESRYISVNQFEEKIERYYKMLNL